ncbi:hypothetical protein A5821_003024 [Enterococcus sp. 7F3_DIV0205]|uniref:Uncharacterized protein n=1 Tax=Candidatus Enterococcus palustris TaxID=1834189 RepID=A0AAQ3Y771_9ENTE|nr:hypothetical protein [Enterococcus sp. 7F3_DIV0205]OTN83458.1 hypothetical protein A5821_003381 [Enterococcus sp. 7F3_DIV0205]
MDEKELEREKERQKELVRKIGEETVAKQQQMHATVEKNTSEIMARMLETIQDTQKLVEKWSGLEQPAKKPDLHLVPPLSSEKPKEGPHD